MEVPLANGASSEAGGSIARGRSAARAGPAPVLTEASIHRRREHSRQASLDMAAREQLAQFRTAGGYERTASYMAQTQSSLRHASIGSEASITGSIRRMRRRANDDDASDVASVASSQWSVRRRRVGPRTFKPVAAPVPATTTTERAQRIAARTAAQRGAAAGGEGGENGERLQGVPVVVRGGARVAASRKSSVDAGDSSFFNGQRLGLSGGGAGSGSVTTVTVSDDDTGELNKSGVSVSLSPDTSGPRSARRSMRQSRHNSGAAGGTGSGSRGGSEFISAADGDFGGDCDDGYDDPLPRATQPMSFDAYPAARAAGGGRSALAAALAPDKAGRPPLTPRGDASPHTGAGGRRNSSLGGAQAIPATQLTSNTVHRHSNSFDFQQQRLQQRRDSAEDSATASAATGARVNGALANGTTATHRVAEGRRSGAEYDAAAGRKSAGGGGGDDDMMDDTPISVLKARAEREAAHNARRDSDPPVVPRLALGEITANREKQRRSSSYTVASNGAAAAAGGGGGAGHVGYAPQTPMTAGSALSEVTVSSMTDSATPHVGGGGGGTRSGRGHGSDHRASHVEDVRVDPSPSVSAVQQTKESGAKAATYDSHGASPVREESAEVPNTTVSPSRLTVVDATASRRREDGEGVATAPPATNSNTSNARTNNNASRTNNGSGSTVAAPAGSEGQQGSTATAAAGAAASTPAASRTAGKGASAAAAAPATKSASRQASPEPKAPGASKATPTTTAAAAPTQSSPSGSKKQRAFEKQPSANAKGTTASPLPPANAASKEKASCCAVM